jgi:hypothetical protein
MQIAILARGLATRLGELTKNELKSLLKIQGKPFIEYQIEQIKKQGITDIVACTDLKPYYAKYGGFLIAGSINKYCNILVNKRFYDNIRLRHSQVEIKNSVAEVEHRIFRAALDFTGIEKGIELPSTADVLYGRREGILLCRKEVKIQTINRRRDYNRGLGGLANSA